MSLTHQTSAQDAAGAERRRTKRVAVAFQIEVSGREPLGTVFNDQARTIDVNQHGCRFDLARQVQIGDTLAIRLRLADAEPREAVSSLFQIVWAIPSETGCTVGAVKLQDKSIWPMNFPEPAAAATNEKH